MNPPCPHHRRMVVREYRAYLRSGMDHTVNMLYLDRPSHDDLVSILWEPGTYMYLSIRDDKAFETVRAYVIEGRLRIDRGIPPSVACPHHFGATVTSISPTVVNVVKDFIDQYGLWDGTWAG